MAELYAKSYGLIFFSGSDNHAAGDAVALGGMKSDTPIVDEQDFIRRVKNGEMSLFRREVKQ